MQSTPSRNGGGIQKLARIGQSLISWLLLPFATLTADTTTVSFTVAYTDPAAHSESQLTPAVFLPPLGPTPSTFLPDSRPPSFGRFFQRSELQPFCVQGSLFLAIGGRGRRGRSVQEESFQIPRHLNIRTNSPSPWVGARLRASSAPRATLGRPTNRHESRLYSKSSCPRFHRPPSSPSASTVSFHLVSSVDVHSSSHPGTGFSLSLCRRLDRSTMYQSRPLLATVTRGRERGRSCVPCYWRSAGRERHFHGKTAVSGVASFYVLHSIVNTQPAVGAFICFYGSRAHSEHPFRGPLCSTGCPGAAVAVQQERAAISFCVKLHACFVSSRPVYSRFACSLRSRRFGSDELMKKVAD